MTLPKHTALEELLFNFDYFSNTAMTDNLKTSAKDELVFRFRKLYFDVGEFLDLNVEGGELKIIVFISLNDVEIKIKDKINFKAAYVYDKNAIYILEKFLIPEVVAHEMAHALISLYFITPPPEKIQEVLAGYVEYMVRKTKNNNGAGG